MAVDIFLKLQGIEGEARDKQHEKQIDVIAWSWGMSQSGNMHFGGGGGSGKVAVSDLSVTKWVDKATNNLIKHCTTGKHIAEGTLIVRKAGGTKIEYVTILLKEIIITSYNVGGAADGQDRLTENITLNFAEFTLDYTPQDGTGGAGSKVSAKYNMATNTPD